mmetsp:Transcript_16879/g.39640  ORF Transcript_16879/g.39640 Transcript_16879/m.39640 type:complete len:226 (-) Transcript_16879:417-1094(-)
MGQEALAASGSRIATCALCDRMSSAMPCGRRWRVWGYSRISWTCRRKATRCSRTVSRTRSATGSWRLPAALVARCTCSAKLVRKSLTLLSSLRRCTPWPSTWWDRGASSRSLQPRSCHKTNPTRAFPARASMLTRTGRRRPFLSTTSSLRAASLPRMTSRWRTARHAFAQAHTSCGGTQTKQSSSTALSSWSPSLLVVGMWPAGTAVSGTRQASDRTLASVSSSM